MPDIRPLQAVLYAHGGEMKKRDLVRIFGDDLTPLITALKEAVVESAFDVYETDTTLSLRTASAYHELVASVLEKEIERDLGAAAREALAIILYKNGATRADVDYMRGVNSSATIRQLTTRGLIEGSKSGGSVVYKATPELYAHMNIRQSEDLPEYAILHDTLTNDHA